MRIQRCLARVAPVRASGMNLGHDSGREHAKMGREGGPPFTRKWGGRSWPSGASPAISCENVPLLLEMPVPCPIPDRTRQPRRAIRKNLLPRGSLTVVRVPFGRGLTAVR